MKRPLKNLALANKLSVMLVLVIVITFGAIGLYFDVFLKQNYLDDTKKRMIHGYERLVYNLDMIKSELSVGASFITTDERMLASIDLVNHYQDKENYSAILLDEEKKLIVEQLLARVKLSFNSAITLYDQNEELIAYVIKEPKGYRLNFITYVGGKAMCYSRLELERFFTLRPCTPNTLIPFQHADYYQKNEARGRPLITYNTDKGQLSIKSNLSIFREDTDDIVAHIELFKILDAKYFEEFSENIDMRLEYSTDPQFASYALPLDVEATLASFRIRQTNEEYVGVRRLDTGLEAIYFLLHLDKAALKSALDRNRWQFIFLLVAVALSALVLTRYLFRRWLAVPMGQLMTQIGKIEHEDYTPSNVIATGDELTAISKNINRLALAVQERESSLKQSQSELLRTQDALKRLNQHLQEEVIKQIEEIRHKDDILIQQSKHAAMGEMISNIAHQWRQPLNTLGLNIQDILDAYEYKELDQAYLEDITSKSMDLIHHMSKTIDDFRNFFAPQKEKKPFGIMGMLKDVRTLVDAQLKNHGIMLEISGEDGMILGFSNELMQVVINIINNAKDALDAHPPESGGKIEVNVFQESEAAVIRICDNGGGIDPEIIQKVFEPYFTTKFKSQGTGIGLYMSKTIVEKNMHGSLDAANEGDGACFTIRLPKNVEQV